MDLCGYSEFAVFVSVRWRVAEKSRELRKLPGRAKYIYMYTDLLTKIHNAQRAKKISVKMPYSNMDMAVADILVETGFILSAAKKGRAPKRVIEIELKYEGDRGAIDTVRFMSLPSRRLYAGYKEMRPVRQGFGVAVVSTPNGIMTSKQARKQKVGGQLLFQIW